MPIAMWSHLCTGLYKAMDSTGTTAHSPPLWSRTAATHLMRLLLCGDLRFAVRLLRRRRLLNGQKRVHPWNTHPALFPGGRRKAMKLLGHASRFFQPFCGHSNDRNSRCDPWRVPKSAEAAFLLSPPPFLVSLSSSSGFAESKCFALITRLVGTSYKAGASIEKDRGNFGAK